MADKLYPLAMKPGIKRDGTKFQGEYCTAGQWMRWQRGTPRKMGGLQAVNVALPSPPTENLVPPHILFLLSQTSATIWAYIGNATGVSNFQFNNNLNLPGGGEKKLIITIPENANLLWQMISIVSTITVVNSNQAVPTKTSTIIFFGCNNLENIENTISAEIYYTVPFAQTSATKVNRTAAPQGKYNPNIADSPSGIGDVDGGMCYAAPYLFFYGSNGKVIISSATYALNFNINDDPLTTAARPLTICNDKIIYGAAIRGGALSPTVLFWSMSSVVRISNTATTGATPSFKVDTLTQACSILSSRCVLEYDGLFFWPGTNRFFTYNGAVQEMINTMSLNYFFDNLDMTRRQLVFGQVNARFGELWWFYPVKGITNGNSRVLIYNIRENSWYDTAYNADSGMALDSNGGFYTISPSFTQPPGNLYLWQHETGVNEVLPQVNNYNPFIRQLGGAASSNTLDTEDNNGGGVASNAFDEDLATACYQTAINGNISYDYGEGKTQTITRVGVMAAIAIQYNLTVKRSNNLIDWEVADTFKPNQQYNPNIIVWLIITNPQPYRAYRIQQTNGQNEKPLAITEIYFDTTANAPQAVSTGISSYFTTPIFSFSSFSPLKEMDGIDRWLQLKRIEPDFVMPKPGETITIQVNTKQFAQDPFFTTLIPGPLPTQEITGLTPKVDFYIQGRQMSVTISSSNFFELGHILLLISVGDGR